MAVIVMGNRGVEEVALAADTVQAVRLPKHARTMSLQVTAGGAVVEWAWEGTDGAVASATEKWTTPAGGSVSDVQAPSLVAWRAREAGEGPTLYLRRATAVATTVHVYAVGGR